MASTAENAPQEHELSWFIALSTYFGYALLIFVGHIRDFTGRLFGWTRYQSEIPEKGYAPLLKSWENFFTRRLYHRIQDCWARPIASSPGAHIDVIVRTSTDGNKTLKTTSNIKRALNLGSYNYLGYADDWKETCAADVLASVHKFPISCGSARMDGGTVSVHEELEQTVARFLNQEAALVYTMGYGTNSTTIPALAGKGSLIISDGLNHTSIVNGSRAAAAVIRVFRHNDPQHLEELLREAIASGQPRTHRPWKKIIVMVEGIYSMEGEICDLRAIVDVCKKYKSYIYVDEAHSIGAIGKTGRGVCEYRGVDPSEIDVLMGTFTKSFGGMGGYIAGSKKLIDHLRIRSAGQMYHNSMSPVVCQQVLTAFKVLMGEDGTDIGQQKLQRLRDNSNMMRQGLIDIGFHVYGDPDSPVIPVMIYNPGKIAAFSREALKLGLALVVVGFPATSVIQSRCRICVSAGHTREDIEFALKALEKIGKRLRLRYAISSFG